MGAAQVRIIGADATANGDALVSLLQVSTKPGKLFSVSLFNTSAADQYILIFDSAAPPAVAAVPKMAVKIPADSHGFFDFPNGRLFRNGIFIGNSSSSNTYVAGAADCLIDADYTNPYATQP